MGPSFPVGTLAYLPTNIPGHTTKNRVQFLLVFSGLVRPSGMGITALHDKADLAHTNIALPQNNPSLPGSTHEGTSHFEVKPRIGREGDRLGLYGCVNINLIEVLWLQEVLLFGGIYGLLEQHFQLVGSQTRPPSGESGGINRRFVLHRLKTAKPVVDLKNWTDG